MRLKWFFRNELTPCFSKTPAFKTNLFWNPPKGHPCLEVYLTQVEKEPLELLVSHLGYSNFIRDEWKAISLADNWNIIIKKADKGSCAVVWERIDNIVAAEKQLEVKNIYQDVNFSNTIFWDLVDKTNKIFRSPECQGKITEKKKLKFFNIRKLLI